MPSWGGGGGGGGGVTLPAVSAALGTNFTTATSVSAPTDFAAGSLTKGDTVTVLTDTDNVRRTYLVLVAGDGSWAGVTKVDITGLEVKSFKPTVVDDQSVFTLPDVPRKPSATTLVINGISYNAYPPGPGITLSGLTITWTDTFKIKSSDDVVITYM